MKKLVLITIVLLGFKFPAIGQWVQTTGQLTTSNKVIVNSTVRINAIEFFDQNLGINSDQTMLYRDDIIGDQTYLKLQLGDEYHGNFEIGYRRYQDAVWVPNFTFKNGSLGIATSTPDEKLTVNGKIHAKEVRVDLSVPAPDYVFEKEYDLINLDELEKDINTNKHLPEIPSASDFEKEGISVGEMNMLLLKKVEELTLYLIDEHKKNCDQGKTINKLKEQVEELLKSK